MKRDSFTFRKTWTKALMSLPVEVRAEVLNAVLLYADTGETVETGDMARAAFLFIKTDMDVEVEARAELSRKRAEAVRKRWARRTAAATGATGAEEHADDTNNTSDTKHTNDTSNTNVSFVSSAASEKERTKERDMTDDVEVEYSPGKTLTSSSPEKEKEKPVYKYTEKESEKDAPKARKIFKPPTVEEVYGFAIEVGASHADPEEFHDFYTSKGWKVGREPMKDWKAAFRRWEREHKKRDEAEERRRNDKNNRTGNGNGNDRTRSGALWSPTDDQRKHPERYYQSTL